MTKKIPNIIHFIYGLDKSYGCKPFSLVHYLAIKSARDVNNPSEIYFYYSYEPSGIWWELARKFVTLVRISAPDKIYGQSLNHYAHKADVLKLIILNKYGGIYLDIDTISIKPLSNFLNYDCVMGKELFRGYEYGLCNAVIISSENNFFLQTWLKTYEHFRSTGKDQFWSEHSVKIPLHIAEMYPKLIHIEPEQSFFWPSYTERDLKKLFIEKQKFPEAYLFHLWETNSFDKYLSKLSIDKIKSDDTTYNLIARRFL